MGALLLIFSMRQTERASPGEIFKTLYPVYFAMDLHQALAGGEARSILTPNQISGKSEKVLTFL